MSRKNSLLPRSIRSRQKLTVREAIWVYAPLNWLLSGLLLIAGGIFIGTLDWSSRELMAIPLVALGTMCVVVAGGIAFLILDTESFRSRRDKIIKDRPRRTREHKNRKTFKELKDDYPQYGVQVSRNGTDMEFSVVRYEPPGGGLIARKLAPWPYQAQRWDVSSERWQVEGHTLRVTNPQTHLLVEAYCEASEAARAMEEEAYDQRAKQMALEGMALAFTPPGKTTNTQQLERIRERVQVRRLLDSGD